jgi:hypothetical protein
MSQPALINDSTSVVQIDTSQLQSGATAIVYISTTANPGQFVTVRDQTGYLSSPQSILLSTTGGARLNSSAATSSLIQQGFGFESLVAQTESNWVTVNENDFRVPSASYRYKTLATTTLNATTFQATGLISTLKTDTLAVQAASTVSMASLYQSTLYVNTYPEFIQSGPTDFDFTLKGSLVVLNSFDSDTGTTRIQSTLNVFSDTFVGGNISSASGTFWLLGDLASSSNIAAPEGLLLSARNVSTLNTGSLGKAVFISSFVTVGAVASTNSLFSREADCRNFVVTSSIQFGAAGDPTYIHYHPGFLDFGSSTIISTITTDSINAGLTLSLNSMDFREITASDTLSSLILGATRITNQYGSLTISTIDGNTTSTGTLLAPFVSTLTNVTSGTITFNTEQASYSTTISYPPNSATVVGTKLVAHAWNLSSIANNGILNTPQKGLYSENILLNEIKTSTIVANQNTISSLQVGTLTLERAFNFNSVKINTSTATSFEAPGAEWSGVKNLRTSTLQSDSLYVNRIEANQPQFFGSSIPTISSLTVSSIQSDLTYVSSLKTYSMRIGAPVEYSTINPSSAYFVVTQTALNSPPYNYFTGIGTYFEKLFFRGSEDYLLVGNVVNPAAQLASALSQRYMERIIGFGSSNTGLYSNHTYHSRQMGVGELPGQLAVDQRNDLYFITGSKMTPTFAGIDTRQKTNFDTFIGETGFYVRKIQDNHTKLGSGQWGGEVFTIAGRSNHYLGDSVPASQAHFFTDLKLCGDGPSSFFINDNNNFALRYIDSNAQISTILKGYLPYPYNLANPGYNDPPANPPSTIWGSGFTAQNSFGNQVDAGGAINPAFRSTIVNQIIKGADGKLYVLDNWNEVVHKIDISDQRMTRWYGKYRDYVTKGPLYDGVGGTLQGMPFFLGKSHCFDMSGNYYFGDESWTLKKCEPPGYTINRFAGNRYTGPPGPGGGYQEYAGDGVPALDAYISTPHALCSDTGNNIYFYDYGTERVRVVMANDGYIFDAAGNGTRGYSGDGGVGRDAEIGVITAMVSDAGNNIYMADMTNHVIRKLDFATSTITTIAGTGTGGYSGDGGLATAAQLSTPTSLYLDTNGNLFIADSGNYRIRVLDTNTGYIYPFAGNTYTTYAGDGGLANEAILNQPRGLLHLNDNSILISDTNNHVIRRIEPSNSTITTIVGTGVQGFNGDGAALSTELYAPGHLSFDYANSTLYFTDSGNNRLRFYNMATQQVSTLAGTGSNTFDVDGLSPAETNLNAPLGVLYDPSGYVFVGEPANYMVRRINLESNVTNIFAGNLTNGYSPNVPANASAIGPPTQLSFDMSNNLHIAMNSPTVTNVSRVNRQTEILEQIMANWGTYYDVAGIPGPVQTLKQPLNLATGLVGLTGAIVDASNNIAFAQDVWANILRTYTYGTQIKPIYLNVDLIYYIGNANSIAVANLNATNLAAYNIFNSLPAPRQVSLRNVLAVQEESAFVAANAIAGGFSLLEGTVWVTGVPNEGTVVNDVLQTGGITIRNGNIRFPNYLADITIRNQFNDARMRNLIYNGSLQLSSDPALKEDISDANLAICYETLGTLPLRTYSYSAAYQSTFQRYEQQARIGFLTTEVAPYFPKSITPTPFEHAWAPSTIQTLDVSQIKYLHLGATKRLSQQVSTLEATASNLEAACSSLRTMATQRTASHS